jgi:glutamine synthetase
MDDIVPAEGSDLSRRYKPSVYTRGPWEFQSQAVVHYNYYMPTVKYSGWGTVRYVKIPRHFLSVALKTQRSVSGGVLLYITQRYGN